MQGSLSIRHGFDMALSNQVVDKSVLSRQSKNMMITQSPGLRMNKDLGEPLLASRSEKQNPDYRLRKKNLK